jgi:hypothetical protein
MKTFLRAVVSASVALCAVSPLRAGDAVWNASFGLLPTETPPPWLFYGEPTNSVFLNPGFLRMETSPEFARATYFQEYNTLSIPTNLVIEARLRFVSGSSAVPGRAPAGIYFYPSKGVANWLWIGKDEIFVNAGARTNKGASASVDTDGSFHTYRIELHGLAAGSRFDVFYDGTFVLTGLLFFDDEDQEPEIAWGDIAYEASGISDWQSFAHNAALRLDTDGDSVPDDEDACPGSARDEAVNEHGCSIDQLVPCSGPATGGTWKNHGHYVKAVMAVADDFLAAQRITLADRNAIVHAATRTNCGRRR